MLILHYISTETWTTRDQSDTGNKRSFFGISSFDFSVFETVGIINISASAVYGSQEFSI